MSKYLLFLLFILPTFILCGQNPSVNPTVKSKPQMTPAQAARQTPPIDPKKESYHYENGDLLFQQLQCGELCDAIHNVTTGVRKTNFSHVGILVIHDDQMYVIEAIDADVHKTPVEVFLRRSVDKQGNPLVAVGRLKNHDPQMAMMATINAENYLGRPYNDAFDWDSPKMYCSQLVLKSYAINGVSIFQNVLQPMTFMNSKTHKFDPIWEKYYGKLGLPIPEGKLGCNPGSLSRDNQLVIYFPFSQFQ